MPLDGVEPDHVSIMRAQIPLDTAAGEIQDTFTGLSDVGYASLALATREHALVIHWKGEIPAATEKAVELVRSRGINVVIVPAQYSLEELQAEMTTVLEWDKHNVDPAYRAHTWWPLHDGSGVGMYVLNRNPQVERERNASGMIRSTEQRPRATLLGNWQAEAT